MSPVTWDVLKPGVRTYSQSLAERLEVFDGVSSFVGIYTPLGKEFEDEIEVG